MVAVIHGVKYIFVDTNLFDFNAKSTAWGSPVTDVRGEALEEWAVSLGLTPMNSGSESTPPCSRLEGGDGGGDHRYIRFDVSAVPVSAHATVGQSSGPRWKLSPLDSQLAKEAAIVESWGTAPDSVVQVDREAARLGSALSRVCDAAMPRAKPLPPRRRVYWWQPELRQLRRACVAARRQYARCRRRRVRDHNLEAALYTAYREACVTLQKAISRAKEEAWREWLATLDADPWGRPYRLVRQKLRPLAPPLTSTLQPDVLESVVGALFSERGEFIPPSMAPLNDHDNSIRRPPSPRRNYVLLSSSSGLKGQPRGPTAFQDVL
ncbi:uncharacterized protein LOC124542774 [Vanessa cardui]|uniref:uncharacterized protein LOC124542774 n=1 Tax=Vanessa cardui TaxID=171605 RepID=UPI001F1458EF|nr:uncharacterized protein LOC124542774 [Vanessa cardui]